MNLKGKTALVTGGATGLGFAIAKKLLKEGAKVYICSRSKTKLDKAKNELKSKHLITKVCDIGDYRQIKSLAKGIGPVDILINNAGIWLKGKLEDNTVGEINQTLASNLLGTILITKAFLPSFKKKNNGYIINISSTSGLKGKNLQSVYVASKYGVQGFTESLKQDLKETNIKVVGFYPGGMKTDLFKKLGEPKGINKWMEPDEVASVIAFIITRPGSMLIDHIVINRRSDHI